VPATHDEINNHRRQPALFSKEKVFNYESIPNKDGETTHFPDGRTGESAETPTGYGPGPARSGAYVFASE
jgi:hypothetical protein